MIRRFFPGLFKTTFARMEYVECRKDIDAPELVVGRTYAIERVITHWWVRLWYGSDIWGVRVYGESRPYHHSYFRKKRWKFQTSSVDD
jgi:hypothetical protein